MTKRAEQVASVLHRAVQSVIESGLSDPRVSGALITVTEVKVTADLLTAVVSVTITPDKREAIVIHGLTAGARHIRRKAGDLIEMHKLPDLIFKVDKGRKRQAEVMQVLAELATERRDASPPDHPDDHTDSTTENAQ